MTVQGTASAAATSVAIPTHAVGDLIVVVTFVASNTAPTKPTASGTVPNWTIAQGAGANTLALQTAWFVATATNHTTGTWTTATQIAVIVLRPASGKSLTIGASSVGNANNTQTLIYPALTIANFNATSWGLRVGARTVAITANGTAPAGWTAQVVQPAGASCLVSVHTRSGLTASPTADTVTTTSSNAPYRAHTLEVVEFSTQAVTLATLAAASVARAPSLVSPGAVTVTGATRAATSGVNAPTVSGGAVAAGPTLLGPVYGQAASGAPTTATTAALDTTGATLLVVAVAYYGNDIGGTNGRGPLLPSYISDSKGNGTPLELTDRRSASGGNMQTGTKVFYWPNPTTVGTGHTFTVASSTYWIYPVIMAVGVVNAALVSPITAENGNNADGGPLTSVNAGTIVAGPLDLALSFINLAQDLTGLTAPSGFTIPAGGSAPLIGGQAFGMAMASLPNAGTVTNPTWTAATDIRCAAVIAVRPTGIRGAFIGAPTLVNQLVSYWSMEDAAGATALDAHGTNHLTVVDGGVGGVPGSVTGKVGNARDFESSIYSYLTHADNAALSTGDIDFTFSLWAKFENVNTGSEVLVAKDDNGSNREYGMFFWFVEGRPYNENPVLFWVFPPDGSGGVAVTTTGFAPAIDTWYHFIGWHDAVNNQIGIVVNNGTPTVVSHSGGVKDGTADFTIGSWADGNLRMDGLIDEVGFWKKVLTSDERAALYNLGAGLSYAALSSGTGGASVFAPTVGAGATSQAVFAAFIGAATATTLLQDSFTGSAGTSLAAHTMDVGSGWTTLLGAFALNSANQATETTASTANASVVANAGQSEVEAFLDITIPSTGSFAVGLSVRAVDAYYQWIAVVERDGGGTPYLSLVERNADVNTVRAGGSGVVDLHTILGTTIRLHVVCQGGLLTVSIGTGETCNYTSSLFQTATKYGLFQYTDAGYLPVLMDNFLVTSLAATTGGGATTFAPTVAAVVAQAVTGAFIGTALLDTLQAYWPFDEASSTSQANDVHDLVDGMHLLRTGSPGVVSGLLGNARQLTSTSHYLYRPFPIGPLTLGSDSPFTWSLWVYLTDKSVDRPLITKYRADPPSATVQAEYVLIYDQSTDRLALVVGNNSSFGSVVANGFGSPPVNTWLHMVCWHDPVADTLNIAINNGTPTSAAWSGGTQGTVNPAYFGVLSGNANPLAGYLDEAGFWKRVLTSTERAALYNAGAGLGYAAFTSGGGVTFPPTVAPGGAGAQAVTTAFLGATSALTAPTVTTGAVTVVGGTVASTAQLFVPTITTGAVSVTTPGRATTIQVFTPTVTVGPVAVTTATRPTTAQLFAPTLTALTSGATIPSGSGVFAPSVALNITTGTRATTIQVFAPTVAVGPATVLGATIASTAQLFLPIVANAGVTNIGGATISTTTQLYAPTVAPQPVTVVLATRPTTAALFAPSVTAPLLGATIVSGSALFAPTVRGTQLVLLAAIAAGSTPYAPTVGSSPIVPGVASSEIFMWLT